MFYFLAQIVVDLGSFSTHFDLHVSINRRDVTTFASNEFADGYSRGTVAVASNAYNHQSRGAGCQQGTMTLMRIVARMRRSAFEADIKFCAR